MEKVLLVTGKPLIAGASAALIHEFVTKNTASVPLFGYSIPSTVFVAGTVAAASAIEANTEHLIIPLLFKDKNVQGAAQFALNMTSPTITGVSVIGITLALFGPSSMNMNGYIEAFATGAVSELIASKVNSAFLLPYLAQRQ